MRLPQMTTGQMMAGVAVIAGWLAIVRWDVALLFLGAASLTYIPSFLWAADGGTFRHGGEPHDPVEGRGDLFLWAWMLSTIGLASFFYFAARLRGVL